MDGDSRAALLAHCVSLTLDGVKSWERRPDAVMAHVETLATALDLDMGAYWKPTAVRYLDRVTKAHIMAAVTDGVSGEAAGRLSGLKKPDMVAAAEPLLVQAGWLPAVLRTARPEAGEAATSEPDPAQGAGDAQAKVEGASGEAHSDDLLADDLQAAEVQAAEPETGGVEMGAPAGPDLADHLIDDAEPLVSLDVADHAEQSKADVAEVEALLAVAD